MKGMRAFVRVIYSSEGKSPAEVGQILMGLGFDKVKGQPLFRGEVSSEAGLNKLLEELHVALRGMEVRYIPSLEAPSDEAGAVVCSVNEELSSWKALGINVDELSALLDSNTNKFRQQAMGIFREKVDAIIAAKEKDLAEAAAALAKAEKEREERERMEGRVNNLMKMLGKEGGATFNELHASSGYDVEELIDMLKGLVESGKARAAQNGRNVVYALG
ncbi:MAG: hypothetical protein LLG16_05380 [Euryarchaeota archaeon]|nr:hypothetical protein [Euryarchaeota archaeon]